VETQTRAAQVQERLQRLEARRTQSDTFVWSVPALALGGQAFLLTIALGVDTRPLARMIAAAAGMLTLAASIHFMLKQSYYFKLYDAAIEAGRKELGLSAARAMDNRAQRTASPPRG